MTIDEVSEITELHRHYEIQRQACIDHPYRLQGKIIELRAEIVRKV